MRHLRLTLDSPAENLALDEALLDAAEAGEIEAPFLRLWESPRYFVVLGRSSPPDLEAKLDACRRQSVPVLRRSSGGGTILAGPGSLMYAVVLSLRLHPQLRAVDFAHRFVLQKMVETLRSIVPDVAWAGTSDLVVPSSEAGPLLKFSGNALRVKRHHLLYHGTLLYDFKIDKLRGLLATPSRQPEYRDDRLHTEFVTNVAASRADLERVLFTGWHATEPLADWPRRRTEQLVRARYAMVGNWLVQPIDDS